MQEPTRVFALRHGQTAWNAAGRIQGHRDIGLDDTGRWQAARLASALADEPLAAIYSSDLARAHDTALALSAATGVAVQTTVELRERCFGHFEGQSFAVIQQRWPEAAQRWLRREPDFAPGDGESLTDFSRVAWPWQPGWLRCIRVRPSQSSPMAACWTACTAPQSA